MYRSPRPKARARVATQTPQKNHPKGSKCGQSRVSCPSELNKITPQKSERNLGDERKPGVGRKRAQGFKKYPRTFPLGQAFEQNHLGLKKAPMPAPTAMRGTTIPSQGQKNDPAMTPALKKRAVQLKKRAFALPTNTPWNSNELGF